MRSKYYSYDEGRKKKVKTAIIISAVLAVAVAMFFVCLFIGSSNMSLDECFDALAKKSSPANNRIMWNIRLPRVFAATVAGAGLAVAGLIMQTALNNSMASPSTLGVSNASVFGANLSLIAFSGGFLTAGNYMSDAMSSFNPFAVSAVAFVFAVASTLLVLGLSSLKKFSANTVVLAGIAIGAVWTAGTSLLQFFATDTGLSAGVVWSFGDLGRATYEQDYIMLAVVGVSLIAFFCLSWRFNALLGGDGIAKSVGVNVGALRVVSLLLASLITATCVSFLGVIGFVGIICPHVAKKLVGNNHTVSIPVTAVIGSILLLVSDTVARSVGSGTALPVGAVTSILGAPFFLVMLFTARERANA